MKEVMVTYQVFDFDELSLKAQQHAHNVFCADPCFMRSAQKIQSKILHKSLKTQG